jgi:hypothetical protein
MSYLNMFPIKLRVLALASFLLQVVPVQGQDLVWAQQMGGSGWDQGRGVTVDASGNIYTTGSFQGTVDFDPGPGVFKLSSAGE